MQDPYLCDPKVSRVVGVHASKLHAQYPNTLDRDDARQEILLHLCQSFDRYDPHLGSVHTFSSKVVANFCRSYGRTHTAMVRMHETTAGLAEDVVDIIRVRADNKVIDKIVLDQVDGLIGKSSNKYAQPLFRLLRQGMTQADCGDILGITESYVAKLVTRFIKKAVKKCYA